MSTRATKSTTRNGGSSPAHVTEQRPRRGEPMDLFEEMQADLARLIEGGPLRAWPLGRSLRRLPSLTTASMPRVDVFERDNMLVIKAEVPGVKQEDIDLEIKDGDLVLRAERSEEREVEEENWYRMERSQGQLYRRLPLPDGVQAESIQASLADGVLEITIPKPEEQPPQAQKIAIT
jgi:HSP20 family protein